jgi:hypothetical protein
VKKSGAPFPNASNVAPATSGGSFNRSEMSPTAGAKNASAAIPIVAKSTKHQSVKNTFVHHAGKPHDSCTVKHKQRNLSMSTRNQKSV